MYLVQAFSNKLSFSVHIFSKIPDKNVSKSENRYCADCCSHLIFNEITPGMNFQRSIIPSGNIVDWGEGECIWLKLLVVNCDFRYTFCPRL